MKYRRLGKTSLDISEISLGTWQVGGKWGDDFDDSSAEAILNSAIDQGVNFIDTADVYSEGLSERAVGRVVRSRSEEVFVASKCGRRITPHNIEGYTTDTLREHVEDSLRRTGLERLDLIQLHCPPPEVFDRPEVFGLFERLKEEGKIRNLGVSVEHIDEAMRAIEFENVTAIQIIFNIFRQRPAEVFFKEASQRDIGVIVRVPLASGLLTGMYNKETRFGTNDHRTYNRDGAAFDKGETFSGVNYETGLKAVDEIRLMFPNMTNLAPIALQWILQFKEVSCVIPGASRQEQVNSNLSVYDLPEMTEQQMANLSDIYDRYIKEQVHKLW